MKVLLQSKFLQQGHFQKTNLHLQYNNLHTINSHTKSHTTYELKNIAI